MRKSKKDSSRTGIRKSPTGIRGLDEITGGGLPTGRPTLVCGGTGCGKTLLGMEFLVNGARLYGEPGVFVAFEETPEELTQNVLALGYDLKDLIARKLLLIDYVHVDLSEFKETDDFDLDGLFIRLGFALDAIRAKRMVIDSIESLFVRLPNEGIVRRELQRLFRWLKDREITLILTGERSKSPLTRFGLEGYVSDCVISLDQRVVDQVTTRRMRVVKYRGSAHGTNEYPFLIASGGISVWPITSSQVDHQASRERISTGIHGLDAMLGGQGYYKGSSILLSGMAGTGKTSMAATFADAACRRGERCQFFSFEESPSQVIRNMGSIGLDLQQWMKKGRLEFQTVRPFHYGLEMHLARMIKLVNDFTPPVVVVDQMSGLETSGSLLEIKNTMIRLIDYLKMKGITAMITDLTSDGSALALTHAAISSLVDTWLVLRDVEGNGERNRGLHILKSRGMAHSNQVREFIISDAGITLKDVYLGPNGMVTGSARVAQQAQERMRDLRRKEDLENRQSILSRKRATLESQVAALRAEIVNAESRLEHSVRQERQREDAVVADFTEMGRSRKVDPVKSNGSIARRNGG